MTTCLKNEKMRDSSTENTEGTEMNSDVYFDEEDEPDVDLNRVTNAIIGAAIAVNSELGPGYAEEIYEAALAIEFTRRQIRFVRQHRFDVGYQGVVVGTGRVYFLVEDRVVVELKAVEQLAAVHTVQVISYLRALKLHLGIILNFNVKRMLDGVKRVAL